MRSLAATFVALLGLFVASVFGLGASTRAGVQCPTAPVQRLLVRDCCGRVVTRAPRPGDHTFVRCRCAEKKAATTTATAATKITFFCAEREPACEFPSLRTAWASPAYVPSTAAGSIPPGLRPPAAS